MLIKLPLLVDSPFPESRVVRERRNKAERRRHPNGKGEEEAIFWKQVLSLELTRLWTNLGRGPCDIVALPKVPPTS